MDGGLSIVIYSEILTQYNREQNDLSKVPNPRRPRVATAELFQATAHM